MIELKTVATITPSGDVRCRVYGTSCYSTVVGLFGVVERIEAIGRWFIKFTNGYSIWADEIRRGEE